MIKEPILDQILHEVDLDLEVATVAIVKIDRLLCAIGRSPARHGFKRFMKDQQRKKRTVTPNGQYGKTGVTIVYEDVIYFGDALHITK